MLLAILEKSRGENEEGNKTKRSLTFVKMVALYRKSENSLDPVVF